MSRPARAPRGACSEGARWLRPVGPHASAVWLREMCPGSASSLPRLVGESGLDRRTGVQGPQHGDRGNGGAGEIGRDVLGDAGKAQNIDVQHLTGPPRRFEILSAVVSQTKFQAFSGRGLLDYVCVTFELVTDRRSNEISAVRVEPVLHH